MTKRLRASVPPAAAARTRSVLAAGDRRELSPSTTNATPAPGAPVSNPAHPVVDASWIYAENWFDSTNFIYKVAGSDGCLPSATTARPAAQTDRQQQPARRTTTARRSSTRGGRASGRRARRSRTASSASSSSARDHLFPTRSWQLNDAELTIPGATCGGPAGHARESQRLDAGLDATPASGAAQRQRHADEHDALRQLGQRLGLRREHGRAHEPRGDRLRPPLARG